ncbi:hypothetical protein [Aeromonas salmonicida]|uniref:hypothetical protein n=1 Tax=Aeromonas salmonicida TaxID=645 RepID=UPI0024A8100B|nr:hypothetical protein [Aeromonas salmonicida]MDM5134219.1 hypothetical protein [Aeromonas salmonicida]WHF42633.1 hypothetical protein QJ050_07720 [Aeromonas salmonicida]
MRTSKYVFVFLFFIGFFSYGGEIIQGPYKISHDTDFIRVEKNSNVDCPIELIIAGVKASYTLDKLCVNGDIPNVRSVFFVRLRDVNYIGTIVSWYNKHQAEGIDQTDYQVTIYKKNKKGIYVIDTEKNNNAFFYGTEDGTGDGSYRFNNASALKKYLMGKYN